MFDNTWAYGVEPTQHPYYQPVVECTYWTVLGSLNTLNTIQFTNKKTSSEEFDEVNKVVLDGISYNTNGTYVKRTMENYL